MATLHQDPSFDRELRRSLLVADRGAADVGEVLGVAQRVRAGDVGGWEREWQRIADRALASGDDLLGADDLDGACRAFLRAAEYYRQAGFYSDGASRRTLDMAHVNAFRAAMALLPVLAEIVDIAAISGAAVRDGESPVLRGYLFRVAGGADRPLVLALVGAGSTAEAGYAEVAMRGHRAGLELSGPGYRGTRSARAGEGRLAVCAAEGGPLDRRPARPERCAVGAAARLRSIRR